MAAKPTRPLRIKSNGPGHNGPEPGSAEGLVTIPIDPPLPVLMPGQDPAPLSPSILDPTLYRRLDRPATEADLSDEIAAPAAEPLLATLDTADGTTEHGPSLPRDPFGTPAFSPQHSRLVPQVPGLERKKTFEYEIELEISGAVSVYGERATTDCKFRHFHESAISLQPGASGQLNVGYRLYDATAGNLLFEDRMLPETNSIEPGRWISGRMQFPRRALRFRQPTVLVVDMLKEQEFWFASTREDANRFTVTFYDATENEAQPPSADSGSPNGHTARESLFELSANAFVEAAEEYWAVPSGSASPKVRYHLVFDVSDLVQYFQDARLPTGIQRVQMQIITNLVHELPEEYSLKIACFTKRVDFWTELPSLFFNRICRLALASGDTEAADWRRVVEELRDKIEQGHVMAFPLGAFLINLGTSWWLQNYFLNVRMAKARYGIRYVPYVHDCIPIVTPEHCVADLTRDFITWAIGVFQHADHLVVNSRATGTDLVRISRFLGHDTPEPAVVRLDAEYGHPMYRNVPTSDSQLFLQNDLRSGEYVLFVSTIESRKNHVLAFSAWLTLMKKFGVFRVPKLVCVGNHGWLNEAVYAKLTARKELQQKVLMLSKVPDSHLEHLYRNCLFTLFPSSYEGWGLPVTESLCCGKIPLISNCSSLPEAGGEFAEYFEVGSETGLVQKLERLIFDAEYRQRRERKIAAEFQPRSWSGIGASILELIREWSRDAAPASGRTDGTSENRRGVFEAHPGRFYGLTENTETRIWPGMISGEIFRQGSGWWWPERWGTWTKPTVARLAFSARFAAGSAVVLFICIRGVQTMHSTAIVTVSGIGTRHVPLGPEQDRWLAFKIPPDGVAQLRGQREHPLFEILFSADQAADFGSTTNGADHRIALIGVRGFMVCAEDDVGSRFRIVESVMFDDHAMLEDKPVETGYLIA